MNFELAYRMPRTAANRRLFLCYELRFLAACRPTRTTPASRDGSRPSASEQSNRELSQKRGLAEPHRRRLNSLQDNDFGFHTRSFTALYGNVVTRYLMMLPNRRPLPLTGTL